MSQNPSAIRSPVRVGEVCGERVNVTFPNGVGALAGDDSGWGDTTRTDQLLPGAARQLAVLLGRALDSGGQAPKGAWGMSRRQEASKGAEDCDKPGETVKQVMIPGFPNWPCLNP